MTTHPDPQALRAQRRRLAWIHLLPLVFVAECGLAVAMFFAALVLIQAPGYTYYGWLMILPFAIAALTLGAGALFKPAGDAKLTLLLTALLCGSMLWFVSLLGPAVGWDFRGCTPEPGSPGKLRCTTGTGSDGFGFDCLAEPYGPFLVRGQCFDSYRLDPQPMTTAPTLTPRPTRTLTVQPRPTETDAPIGELILYQKRSAGQSQLWTVDADTAVLREITNSGEWTAEYPVWSPDGHRIAYTGLAIGTERLQLVDWRGQLEQTLDLSAQRGGWSPQWSPDSETLAYVGLHEDRLAVFTLGLDSGMVELHMASDMTISVQAPLSWAPDGRSIAFGIMDASHVPVTGPDDTNPFYVVRMDLGNAGFTRLTDGTLADRLPVWSPDGSLIAFQCSDSDDVPQICTVKADGTDRRQLTQLPGGNFGPVWSPDGSRIAFVSWRDNSDGSNYCIGPECNHEIYEMNADGSQQTRLTHDPSDDDDPAWSPDGTRIAFSSGRSETRTWLVCGNDCNTDIYVMDADGSNVRRLTESHSQEWNPQWRPIPPESATVP